MDKLLNSQTWCHRDGSLAKHLHPSCSSSDDESSIIQDYFRWLVTSHRSMIQKSCWSKCMNNGVACASCTLYMCMTCIYRLFIRATAIYDLYLSFFLFIL
jgi:hypothetical protein